MSVVIYGDFVVGVVFLRTKASERGKNDAMLKSDVANLYRGEEIECGHRGYCMSRCSNTHKYRTI